MKLKISDMMDDLPCIPVEIGEKEFVTASRIRAQTMQRLHAEAAQGKPVRRISGAGLAAAVIAAALCVSATAAVVAHKWPGFVFTGSMSEAEKDRMLEETSVIHAMEQIDADGTVHYFGEDGREELVLVRRGSGRLSAAANRGARPRRLPKHHVGRRVDDAVYPEFRYGACRGRGWPFCGICIWKRAYGLAVPGELDRL